MSSSTGGKSQTISPQSNDKADEASGSIISPPSASGRGRHEESSGIQLRTSARVSKKLKLEAEAAAQSQPEQKKDNTEEKKPPEPEKPLKRRAHELWSTDDKNTFFEALNEYGKDFDAIAKYMMAKVKKKGVVGAEHCSKTRAQVRCFYYRTWHKIAKHLNFPEGVQKLTQELYGLINFGEMRKKCGVITVKNCIKLNELIYGGITQIRIKGKSLRIRTPNCRAMRKINQVMDSEEDKIPSRIIVELRPKDKATWHTVQAMSMNPRVRTTVTNHTKLATLLNYLQKIKWKQNKGTLCVAPQSDATISLPSVKRNEASTSSHSAFSLLNHEKKFGSPALVSTILGLLNQIRHSTPGNRKRQRADSSSDKSKSGPAVGGGESSSSESEKKDNTGNGSCYDINLPAFSLPVFSVEPAVGETSAGPSPTSVNPATSSPITTNTPSAPIGQCKTPTTSPNKDVVPGEVSKELPKPETILQGWTLDTVHNTQVGHLYSMFGNEGKVVLTYCWEDVKPDFNIRATLQHMLLAAKLILNKNTSTAGVTCPCGHTCDAKPNLTSSENTAGVIKSPGDTFKRPKPKVEPQDEFQAQLDKFQPKSYSKRFRSKNLIVHRVHPLNTPSPPPRTHPTPSRTTVQSPSNSMSPSQSNNIPPSSVISHPTSSMQDSLYTISGEVRSDIASSTLGGLRSDGSSTHSGIRSDGLPSSGIRSDNASSKLGGLRSDVASTHSGLRSEGSASSGIRSDGASPAQGGLRSDGASPVESGVRSSERSLHSGLRSDTDSGLRSGSEVKSGGNSNNNGDTSDFLGNLMDTSLSSTAAKDAVAVLDELMDISFPHLELEASTSSSPNNFTGLIPTKEDSISLPSSPSKLLKEGENKWLSSEVADYSLSSLLGHLESPAKPAIPSDMQSMMSESSVDYMAKFADLAAQMANDETCKN